MSSKAKRAEKSIEEYEKKREWECNLSLIGSIMLTCGKLAGVDAESVYADFANIENKLPKRAEWSIRTLCDWFIENYYNVSEEQKKYIVVAYDNKGVLTPIVTLMAGEEIYPVRPDGVYHGILTAPSRLETEFVYA